HQICRATDRLLIIENNRRVLIVAPNDGEKFRQAHGFPGTGKGVAGGDKAGLGVGETGGISEWLAGAAAGVAEAPGCVRGCAAGGFAAPVGWPRISDSGPVIETGAGVADGAAAASGLDGGAAPVAVTDAVGAGVAIGPAGAGFF